MRYIFFTLLIIMSMQACSNKDTLVISTEYGDMEFQLFEDTPLHTENIKKLAKEGYYDDLLFHRVIKGFMIQGGDPNSKDAPAGKALGMGGPDYLVDAEIGHKHFKGALAAARRGGPSNPDKKSSGSQFYIVQGRSVKKQMLESQGKMKGINYTEEEMQMYEEKGGTPMLDGDYTVFGQMTSGEEVLDKIAQVATDGRDRPVKDVKMKVTLK